jgi:hypothetical protein
VKTHFTEADMALAVNVVPWYPIAMIVVVFPMTPYPIALLNRLWSWTTEDNRDADRERVSRLW